MPIDWLLILKILRLILQALEQLPASYDHTQLSASAGGILDHLLTSPQKGVTLSAKT